MRHSHLKSYSSLWSDFLSYNNCTASHKPTAEDSTETNCTKQRAAVIHLTQDKPLLKQADDQGR